MVRPVGIEPTTLSVEGLSGTDVIKDERAQDSYYIGLEQGENVSGVPPTRDDCAGVIETRMRRQPGVKSGGGCVFPKMAR